MNVSIGIPRALFCYRFYSLWKTFFEELGVKVVLSSPTNRKILDDGVGNCVDEACLPVKIFHGHVLQLKDEVDYLFIPRLTSISKHEYICPKFGGLPDMVRNTIRGLPPIIDTEINMRRSKKEAVNAAIHIGERIGANRHSAVKAYQNAVLVYQEHRALLHKGLVQSDIFDREISRDNLQEKVNECWKSDQLHLAVISHEYNYCDSYTSMDLLRKLRNKGANITTLDRIEEDIIKKKAKTLSKSMFWEFGRRAIGGTYSLLDQEDLDGIIFVTSFGCGIDSFVCDLLERHIKRSGRMPFTVITIDEHSGEAGLDTRIEAFMDMVKIKKSENAKEIRPNIV